MKIKNTKLSLLILASLIILSFAFFTAAEEAAITGNNIFLDSDQDGLSDEEEKTYGTDPQKSDTDGDSYSDGAEVTSGYDPTKPAPGDKVVPEKTAQIIRKEDPAAEEENLTQEIANKVSSLVGEEGAETAESITMTDIEDVVNQSLQPMINEESLPEISPEEIKIKDQDYKGLSEEKKTLKKREDFLSYLVGVSYIVSSNSPVPVTSESDLAGLTSSFTQQIVTAITTQNPAALDSLASSGEKVMNQMKDVEVPEELVDLHVKGLQFSKYAVQLKDDLSPNPEDPMKEIVNFSKMQGLMDSVLGFGMEVQSKVSQYEITTVEDAAEELKNSQTVKN